MIIAATLLLLLSGQAGDNAIVVKTSRWAPFISPMGEPFRPADAGDDTLGAWFNIADSNRDGILTPVEVEADAMRFFATLDEDADGNIDPTEMNYYEWDVARDVQISAKRRPKPGESIADVKKEERKRDRERFRDRQSERQGAARYTLLNMPQPVAAADTDFNRLVSATEFRAAAAYRFTLLDTDDTGQLTYAGLSRFLSDAHADKGKKRVPAKDRRDTRVANPMPTDRGQP